MIYTRDVVKFVEGKMYMESAQRNSNKTVNSALEVKDTSLITEDEIKVDL